LLRTIAGELGRIQSHLLCVGAAGWIWGVHGILYGFNQRETIYDIVEYIVGAAVPHELDAGLGGLNMDLPDEATFVRM